MSNNLYEEAINAAEQIKEAAENKVKQQLIEAMSPKIKQMIQETYIGEEQGIEGNHENLNLDEYGLPEDVETEDVETEDVETENAPLENKEISNQSDAETIEISEESLTILTNMLQEKNHSKIVNNKLESIREGINHLKKAIIIAESSNKVSKFKKKFVLAFNNLLQELKNIK